MVKTLHEEDRLQELLDYEILDTAPEAELDELAKLASLICDVPISLITLLDHKRQWFKANVGLDAQETPREVSFCQHTLHKPEEVLVISDSLEDERVKDSPLVTASPNIRFYAGAPLVTPSGQVLGTLCVIDTKPRLLKESQVEALQVLAKKAMSYLNTRKLIANQKESIEFTLAQLKKLTDQSPGALFQCTMNEERIISFDFISSGVTKIHERLSPKMIVIEANTLFKVVHPEDLPIIRESVREAYDQLANWKFQFRVMLESGDQLWLQGNASPEKLDNGKVAWYGTLQDITQRVEYENAMEQIAFDISHILRQPVATLLGLTSLIEEEKEIDQKDLKVYSQHIKTVAENMDTYTRKLSDTYNLKNEIINGRNRT